MSIIQAEKEIIKYFKNKIKTINITDDVLDKSGVVITTKLLLQYDRMLWFALGLGVGFILLILSVIFK